MVPFPYVYIYIHIYVLIYVYISGVIVDVCLGNCIQSHKNRHGVETSTPQLQLPCLNFPNTICDRDTVNDL